MFKTALLSWGSGFICVLKILLTVTFELLKGKGRVYPPSLAIWLSDSKSEALGVWEALVSGGTVAMRGAALVQTVPSLASAGEPFRLEAAGPQGHVCSPPAPGICRRDCMAAHYPLSLVSWCSDRWGLGGGLGPVAFWELHGARGRGAWGGQMPRGGVSIRGSFLRKDLTDCHQWT